MRGVLHPDEAGPLGVVRVFGYEHAVGVTCGVSCLYVFMCFIVYFYFVT